MRARIWRAEDLFRRSNRALLPFLSTHLVKVRYSTFTNFKQTGCPISRVFPVGVSLPVF